MDIYKAIQDLHEEKRRLDRVIESLESVIRKGDSSVRAPSKRRGRKNMSEEERRIVSERMKKYWVMRRKQKPAGRTPATLIS